MSEYKICVTRSNLQSRLQWLFYGLCLVAIWFWPLVYQWQWIAQLSLSVALLMALFYQTRSTPSLAYDFVMSDIGEVYFYHKTGESYPFRLAANSVVSDWFCLLILQPSGLALHKKRKCWVFKDAVDEQSYRRICRTIYKMRREGE